MSRTLMQLMDNDNEIGNVYRDKREYVVEINKWDGSVVKLRTVNCKMLSHNINLVDEFGEIVICNSMYKFMTADNEEVILEIEADDLLIE